MNKANVLMLGSGGREHALAWKIKSSPLLNNLYLANPNDGFKSLGEEVVFADYEELAKICKEKNIDLVVVGPEQPLSEGIVDVLGNHGIKCIGPKKQWAQLEWSKEFAKKFMYKHSIPTAAYEVVTDESQIDGVLKKFAGKPHPPVLKADGLAAGKGVAVPQTVEEAKGLLAEFLNGKFGDASKRVVVEEFLEGEELSVLSIFDGKTLKTFMPARDYKRLRDNNEGPNTGGMGSFCPVLISDFHEKKIQEYLKMLEGALVNEKADFCGIVYSGLMLTKDGVRVVEYNMRFGDPETQPIMMHLKSDLLEIFIAAANQNLANVNIEWNEGTSLCVILAAQGYPEAPKKGCPIENIEEAEKEFGVKVFFAGVKHGSSGSIVSNGGRVLCVCASGQDIRENVYKACEKIDFADKIYRNDIM